MPASKTTATQTITFRRIGNSIGATFPKEIIDAAGIEEKSTWHVVKTSEGLLLKEHDPEFDAAWAVYQDVKREYHNVFKELAK